MLNLQRFMRLHRNLVFTVIDSLMAIFNEGEYADKVVARALKKTKDGEVATVSLLQKPFTRLFDGNDYMLK